MTPTIAPEHDDQKNYPLFNRLGTAQRIRRASVRVVFIKRKTITIMPSTLPLPTLKEFRSKE